MRVVTTLILLIVAIVCWTGLSFRSDRKWARWRKGLCPRCGYDLRMHSHRCPECGRPIQWLDTSDEP